MSYGPFPSGILREISEYPGNQKCCDCPSLDTDWGSVNHGTLICLECAGKHRSLGVHVSFVRSVYMDTWSPVQVSVLLSKSIAIRLDYDLEKSKSMTTEYEQREEKVKGERNRQTFSACSLKEVDIAMC